MLLELHRYVVEESPLRVQKMMMAVAERRLDTTGLSAALPSDLEDT